MISASAAFSNKLPAEQNDLPNQLIQFGLEMQRSNHRCSVTSWTPCVNLSRWTTMMEYKIHNWMSKVSMRVFTAVWTYSSFRSVGYHRFIISFLLSILTWCNNHVKRSVAASVITLIHPELQKMKLHQLELSMGPLEQLLTSIMWEIIRDLPNALSLTAKTDEGLKDLKALTDDSSNLSMKLRPQY